VAIGVNIEIFLQNEKEKSPGTVKELMRDDPLWYGVVHIEAKEPTG
jgi:hypothetical protein